MSTMTTSKARLSFAVLVLGIVATAMSASPAQAAVTFSFTSKLELNPLPFTDAAHNAYWHGKGKYSNSHDVWKVTLTVNTDDKHPNDPDPGIITIDKMHFKAVNMKIGGKPHEVDLQGTISTFDNSILLTGTTQSGRTATLQGVVRSWWTVKGVRKGPNVIQAVLSFK
jgi:hypothetical protein